MLIGFFLDNRSVGQMDFSRPWEGNPGTGAAEYLHVATPHFISEYCGDKAQCIIFAPYVKYLPRSVDVQQANSIVEAAYKAKAKGVDYFVFRPRLNEEKHILDIIDDLDLPSIGRAALTPKSEHIRRMAKCHAFKALVCVGREQYDFLMDTAIYNKIAYIDNGIHVASCSQSNTPVKDHCLVAYMGALVPQKGLHLLAAAWSKVLKRIPNAHLSVIGSIKMYNENARVGPLGIAEESYEQDYLIPHLADQSGKLHPSVTLHGQLGPEKYDILSKALVGIANPSGQTETCCVSAVEMAACHTAVVSGAFNALLDTVLHGKTGLLGRTIDDLADNICTLLENPNRAIEMGRMGHERTLQQYDFSVVAPKWFDLCEHLKRDSIPNPRGDLKNIFAHFKFLRLMNRPLQKFFNKFFPWPSLHDMEIVVWRLLKFIKRIMTRKH